MAGREAISATRQNSTPIEQKRPEDVLRDLLERAHEVAEDASFSIIAHIVAMGLEELNEMEGLGSYYALMLREATKLPRSGD